VSVLLLLCLGLIALDVAFRFARSIWQALAWSVTVLGLACYVLAFFRRLGWSDALLILGGALALADLALRVRREGFAPLRQTLKREFCSVFFWVSLALLAAMVLLLRNELILEWDGYNFWAPDVKSLFYRGGYAPRWSNVAYAYGNYTPFMQLLWWWLCRLAGSYQERMLYWGQYLYGMLLMLSVAVRFVPERGKGRVIAGILAPAAAFALPGAACTAWYFAIRVDPIMSMHFGLLLVSTVLPPQTHRRFGQIELLTWCAALALTKSIGVMWAIFAAVFYLLWRGKQERRGLTAGAMLCTAFACGGSWTLFCRLLQRSGYLTNNFAVEARNRLAELRAGTLWTTGYSKGFLDSYTTAFLKTPIHRESTIGVDLTPLGLVLLIVLALVLLRQFGFLPKNRFARTVGFALGSMLIAYAIVFIGQLTMFCRELQYLDPVKAVVLLMRYASPIHIGLLMLIAALATGQAEGASPDAQTGKRRAAAGLLTAAVLIACTSWTDIYHRFWFDPLDETRIEKRLSFEADYAPLFRQTDALPLDQEGVRVLLCTDKAEMNPIVIHRASPVSLVPMELWDDAPAALEEIFGEVDLLHCGYLYVQDCSDEMRALLSECTEAPFAEQTLYRAEHTDRWTLTPVP
jgi:hypothetical protein